MSYSHSRKPVLPVTHSSPLSTWLSVLFFFPPPLKPRCQGRVMGFVGYTRGLHAVLWSHIGTLMHPLAAEPCSTAGLLFHSRCPSGTILLTPYWMVWDWRVSRAGPMLLYWPKLLYPYYSLLLFFPFSSFCLSVGIVGLGSSD